MTRKTKIDEQLWVRVLELEQSLKEQEEQANRQIEQLKEQLYSLRGYFQGLCLICAAVGALCVNQLIL